MKIRLLWGMIFGIVMAGTLPAHAQRVDSVMIFSPSMNKEIKNVVILPQGYWSDDPQPYPVVYLLHGFGGNYAQWIGWRPELTQDATAMRAIIVCPDGGVGSWYWDSPKNPAYRYETYLSTELVQEIDKRYNTLQERSGRAITGGSMGGHGGLWIGFRHSDTFGACGSIFGGVDIRPFPDNWQMRDHLGEYHENPEVWNQHTVINQIYRIRPMQNLQGGRGNAHLEHRVERQLAIIIDCGVDDFFYDVNLALHEALLHNNIMHDFIVRPGVHNGVYAADAVSYQLLFFKNYFTREAAFAAQQK